MMKAVGNVTTYVSFVVLLSGAIVFAANRSQPVAAPPPGEDFDEDCQKEECDTEEVSEYHESYREECMEESCGREEIIELGGTPSGASAMLEEFRRRGWSVNNDHFLQVSCTVTGVEAACWGVVQMCKDFYACPDGNQQSSWHACGSCLGFG